MTADVTIPGSSQPTDFGRSAGLRSAFRTFGRAAGSALLDGLALLGNSHAMFIAAPADPPS